MYVDLPENYFKKGSPTRILKQTAGNVNWSIIYEFNQELKAWKFLSKVK